MSTEDLFRTRLDTRVDLRHPLAVLAHKGRAGFTVESADLFGPTVVVAGIGVSAAGRPGLPLHLLASPR